MRAQAQRAMDECLRIAAMSEEPGRITRRFLTAPVRDVHALLRARMEALQMSVTVDAAGNLRGLWSGTNSKRLVIGSHIDTVPNAGAYDGVLGVTMALELVELARAATLPMDIEVIAFSEEEGERFGVPFLGSRAVAGSFDASLLKLTDGDGITVEASMRSFGLDPDTLAEAALDARAVGYLEIHIEQGPVLEAEDLQVAAVTAIVGQTRLSLTFAGHANHAGTTPMHLRRDALAGAAEWITAVEACARGTAGLVATVGRIEVEPNAGNVVAGSAEVSLDLRHAEDAVRTQAVKALLDEAYAIAKRRGLRTQSTLQLDQPAVPMDARLTALLVAAMHATGFPSKQMPSGAGHDAMVMAARLPAAMLFLRSPGGISHHPDEAARVEDVEAALRVALNFMERIAAGVG